MSFFVAKSLYEGFVGGPFGNTVKTIMFLKSRLRFGDEAQEGGKETQRIFPGSHQLIEGTEGPVSSCSACHVAGSLSEVTPGKFLFVLMVMQSLKNTEINLYCRPQVSLRAFWITK